MKISKDTLWKGIIESLVEDFVRFFFRDYVDQIDFAKPFTFLDTELQKLYPPNEAKDRRADRLFKGWLLDGTEVAFLAHVEVQGYVDKNFAKRMWQVSYRAVDKYELQLVGLAIYTHKNKEHCPSEYVSTFFGNETRYRFMTYILADHTPEELAQDPNPFAAVMETARLQLESIEDETILLYKQTELVRRLVQRNIDKNTIYHIINFVRFYLPLTDKVKIHNFENEINSVIKTNESMGLEEAIMEEIKSQAREMGRKEGLREGREKGMKLGVKEGIEKGIEKGMEKGMEKVICNSYRKGFSISAIQDITGTSEPYIIEILSANNLL